ncbi:MAG: hypothetical protein J7J86_02180, partial [Bacteroidales bacterium]|nr:hypothetical protein [Bacteroidales bacterium]
YYIDLQLLRFNNNFDFSFDIDKNINIENIKVPPMLIQPFVENSIEHGIKNLTDRRGKIKIKIEFNDKTLCYKIEDNGIGFEMAKNIEASMKTSDYEKQSLAVSITKDRLKLLGKKKYKESRLKIIQKKNEKGEVNGVLVKICVPYII